MSEPTERPRAAPIEVTATPVEPARRTGVGFAAVAACSTAAALIGGVLGAAAPRTTLAPALDAIGPLPGPAPVAPAEIAALKTGLSQTAAQQAELQRRLAAFEAAMSTPLVEAAGAEALPSTSTALAARLFGLQAEVDAVEARLAGAASTEQIAALGAELQALKASFADVAAEAGRAAKAAASAYAVTAATEAARSAGPFEPAYAALSALLPEDPNVKALAPYAATGAPTFGELKDEYRALEIDIVRAARIAEAGGGFAGQVQAWLANFIVVRRTDQAGVATGDTVARASARIAAEDLAGAVNELAKLSGPPAQVAGPWLTRAKARVEIDARLAALRAELAKGTAAP